MSKIQVLDCTLRDGGYCNEWHFGFDNAKRITVGLVEANVEIIECGFLTNRVVYSPEVTKFTSVEETVEIIPENREGKIFVAMMNYGEYNIDDLPNHDGSSIDGIRVAFHKKNLLESIELCKAIKAKGYLVFVQAMVSLSYSDEEFLNLIRSVNEFEPYAFYIVDSFGMMKRKDLIRLFYLVEHNLKESIKIGFHSHNNMQLAYSNAQGLVDLHSKRDLIIDASVFGMGRGAGNLNTELFVEYLNENAGGNYDIKPLLTIIDEILNDFYQRNYWGYSLPNYLSASHNAHPNYAGYLDNKKTLTVEDMNEIFDMMDDDKKVSYDKDYIEDLYLRYMESGQVQDAHLAELKEMISGKEVLIIAPGRSSADEKDQVIQYASKENIISIGINFDYGEYDTDFIFLSNLRRFRELDKKKIGKCIVTSNIPSTDAYLRIKYQELLNRQEAVRDNAGMMLIQFLINLGVNKVYIAGIDGYSPDPSQNFADEKMNFYTQKAVFKAMNEGLSTVMNQYRKQIAIEYVTKPRYVFV